MDSNGNYTKAELVESVVPHIWVNFDHSTSSLKPITLTTKRRLNRALLLKLRRMDYLSRDRLHTFMGALLGEQEREREGYKESLYRLVSLIDQLEKEVKEAFDQFTKEAEEEVQADKIKERLLNAILRLPCEKLMALLEFAEQQETDK